MQKIPIVRRDLDHLRLRSQMKPLDCRACEALGMLEPGARKRREIGVIRIEDLSCRLVHVDLGKEASVAKLDHKGIIRLGQRQAFPGEQRVRRGQFCKSANGMKLPFPQCRHFTGGCLRMPRQLAGRRNPGPISQRPATAIGYRPRGHRSGYRLRNEAANKNCACR